MTTEQVEALRKEGEFPYPATHRQLLETHISWVILTDQYVYKLKKPMQYSFLDFSTVEKRRYYCHRELVLNRRLTRGMYLDVLPVRQRRRGLSIGGEKGDIIDYTLLMRRMDDSRQMDRLLQAGAVYPAHMKQLADRIAEFHHAAHRVPNSPTAGELSELFADVLSVRDFMDAHLGAARGAKVARLVDFVRDWLEARRSHLHTRWEEGWIVDGHGDLHSKNILLLDEPVIFDCIEFNDSFRQIDLLNEIAFFCMDLDAYDRPDLAEVFLEHYLRQVDCMPRLADRQLFLYYKMYRANVRLKVNCLRARQPEDDRHFQQTMKAVEDYYALLMQYEENLKAGE